MALVGHTPQLVVVLAFDGASGFIPFVVLFFELLLQFTTALFNIVERFKILCEGLDRLFGELSSRHNELVAF